MLTKICGTTSLADAQLAVELGADAVGFIFAPSKRRVSAEQVAGITPYLPARIGKVGVFTEPDAKTIVGVAAWAGLTAVQLHTRYDPERIAQLDDAFRGEMELWQVIGFEVDPADPETAGREFERVLHTAMLDSRLSVVLLDSVKNGASGGQGQSFSWQSAAPVLTAARRAAADLHSQGGLATPKIVLAGGLHAENVETAIRWMEPWGVDVVSGVEAEPGRKSRDRLSAFLNAVRGLRAM